MIEEFTIKDMSDLLYDDLSKIKDKDTKMHYKTLKKQYALPDMRTTEQKEADFGRAFW